MPMPGALQVMFAEPMNLRAMGQKPSPPEAARMHLAASQESEEVVQQHTGSMSGARSAVLAIKSLSRNAQHPLHSGLESGSCRCTSLQQQHMWCMLLPCAKPCASCCVVGFDCFR